MFSILLTVAFALAASPARASLGQSGGLLLQQPFGARGFALGDAYGALADDVFGMSYNPATLTRLRKSAVGTEFIQSLEQSSLGYLTVASPLSPSSALGLSVSYFDAGKADIYDAAGNQTRTISAQKDLAARLGYAHALEVGAGRLHLGVSGTLLKSSVAEEASASAFAGDLGALYERPFGRDLFSAAASMSNIGTALQYSGGLATGSESTPLQRITRLALGYEKDFFSVDRLAAGFTLDQLSPDGVLVEGVGLEYNYHGLCALRLGYRADSAGDGIRSGLGFKYKDIAIDYAFGLASTFNNIQQLSITYGFAIPGVRYGKGASELGGLAAKAQAALSAKRYFAAAEQADRIESVFGPSAETNMLRRRVETEIEAMTGDQRPGFERAYAGAFKSYRAGEWADSAAALEACRQQQPENEEIRDYREKALERVKKQESLLKLQQLARTGTLFEIANQAYETGDLSRARRIVDEILRLGRYQPAESLKARIAADASEAARPAPTPPIVPKPSAPTAGDAARAEDLYYDAVRRYAENDLVKALEDLYRGLKLDPTNANIRSTLDRIEKEYRQRSPGAPLR